MVQLTQKETMLLKDLKSHEELCIKKYSKSAKESQDTVLKQLFTTLAQQEQQHLNTINQIISGQVPSVGQGQQSQQQSQWMQGQWQGAQPQQQGQWQQNQGSQQQPQGQWQQNQGSQQSPQNQQNQSMSSGQQQTQKNPFLASSQNQYANQSTAQNQNQGTVQNQGNTNFKSANATQEDLDLCHDLLSTEKYISSTYNTAIFEFRDPNIRQVLNHIQKEEQEHGLKIFSYLQQNGGYQAQA